MSGDQSIQSGMPGRYATALFELAHEAGALDAVAGDVEAFRAMLDESDELRRMVRSPVFTANEQERALDAVMNKAGISGLVANFLKLLARNRRLFAVADVLKAFRALLARHRGEVTADVTSAKPLSDDQMQALKQSLRASIGKDVQVNTAVDPSLLGGLIVKVGSRMIDSSIRTKLNALGVAMKEVG